MPNPFSALFAGRTHHRVTTQAEKQAHSRPRGEYTSGGPNEYRPSREASLPVAMAYETTPISQMIPPPPAHDPPVIAAAHAHVAAHHAAVSDGIGNLSINTNGSSSNSLAEPTNSGLEVLKSQHVNEGTAFPAHARTALHLRGLLPPIIETLDKQVARSVHRIRSLQDPLEKFMYLDRLRHEDTTLFYKIVVENLREIVSIIYTPTVGTVCQQFSHIYTPGSVEGLFLSLSDMYHLDEVLSNWTYPEPEICVMTDGSRILGLGDLGVNGMGIPVGKLSLYVAAGGINPSRTLPITLDLGTNTPEHLNDVFYLGTRTRRPDEATFFAFLDAVMAALHRKWPSMLVQFEDFSSEHAFETLDRYRDKYCMFNDDIQGTGAVVLAGFINALNLSGIKPRDHRILFVGAGSAGVGVASQIMEHFAKPLSEGGNGLTRDEARDLFWLMDSKGLVTDDRRDANNYPKHKTLFSRKDNQGVQISELLEAVKYLRPTALIGLSAQGGVFTEAILREMAKLNERPIVFPLSNPSANAECSFEEAMKYTDGRVLFASGTAFPSYPDPRTGKLVEPGQGNNMYIFPGLGLAAVLSHATRVTDKMVHRSAVSLSENLSEEEKSAGMLYPRLERIREISAVVARDVILAALEEDKGIVGEPYILGLFGEHGDGVREVGGGVAAKFVGDAWKAAELLDWVRERMYEPAYPSRRLKF
ncbi:hypothetical protein HDU76_012403 [Blyttiomyces sp. JEL0837]|nr:hypothetical protein HDU76_012403 [Blyttiomyces sp. JEL0837]